MNILSIDLGKYKSVFCMYDAVTNTHCFGVVKTAPQEMHDLIIEKDPDRVVFEIGTAAGWITDIAKAVGKEVQVANTTHEAWRWKNIKRKTDRDDALKLAQLSAMDQLPKVHIPTKDVLVAGIPGDWPVNACGITSKMIYIPSSPLRIV